MKKNVVGFLNDHVLQKNRHHYFFEFMKYFSKVGRQYVKNLKIIKSRDFDLHLLSAEIDSGLWGKPLYNTLSAVSFEHDIDNKEVDNVQSRFELNDMNFRQMFNSKLVVELFKPKMKKMPSFK